MKPKKKMVPQTAQATIRKQESISARVRNTRLKLEELIIPITIGIILVFITIFLFVPMLKSSFQFRSELKELNKKKIQLTDLKTTVESLSEEELSSDLIQVKSVIPRTLKVASFLYYIDELAKSKNLTSEKLSGGDVDFGTDEEEDQEQANNYKGVNGPLAYEGSLDNVLSFLDSFYSSSPYIVSPEAIKLEKNSNENETWLVKLNLTGYYISEDEDVTINLYKPFKPYNESQEVMKILKEKAKKLNSITK